jgi:hypothetical protein
MARDELLRLRTGLADTVAYAAEHPELLLSPPAEPEVTLRREGKEVRWFLGQRMLDCSLARDRAVEGLGEG